MEECVACVGSGRYGCAISAFVRSWDQVGETTADSRGGSCGDKETASGLEITLLVFASDVGVHVCNAGH